MLLYLSEYKLAEYLNDKDISVLAKILLCLFAAFIILSIFIRSIHIFPSNLIWVVLFVSFFSILVKNRKHVSSLTAHLTYLIFPIALKAWLLHVVIILINSGVSIAYVTYAQTNANINMDSMMGDMLSNDQSDNTPPSYAESITPFDVEVITNISGLIALAVTLIFVRWRYHECVKIMSKYNV